MRLIRDARRIWVFSLLALLVLAAPAWSASYYVANAGNDACTGLSQTIAASGTCAWKTVAKVNGSTFNAGDSILFNRGDIFREQLTVPSSGSAGLPITFGAYGTGEKPIFDGDSALLATWTALPHLTYGVHTFADGFETDLSAWGVVSGAAIDATKGRSGSQSVLLDAQWDVFGRSTDGTPVDIYTSFSFYINNADWSAQHYFYRQDWEDNGAYVLFGVDSDDTIYIQADGVKYSTAQAVSYQAWNDVRIHVLPGLAGACVLEVWYKTAAGATFTKIVDQSALTWAELSNGTKPLDLEYFQLADANISVNIDNYRISAVGFGDTVYRATAAPTSLYLDAGVLANRAYATDPFGTSHALLADEWSTDGATYVYLAHDPTPHTLISGLPYGIYLNAKHYVTIDGIEVKDFGLKQIWSSLSDSTIVQNCTVSGGVDPTSVFGIQIQGAAGNLSTGGQVLSNTVGTIGYTNQTTIHLNAGIDAEYTSGVVVRGNTIVPVYVAGITSRGYINNQSSGATIESNIVSGFYALGINVMETAGTVLVQRNHVYSGFGGGIALGYTIAGATVAYNVVHDLTGLVGQYNGIDLNNGVTNSFIYNNTVYKVSNACITIEVDCLGNTIKNNILDSSIVNDDPAVGDLAPAIGGYSIPIYQKDASTTNGYDYNFYNPPPAGVAAGKVAYISFVGGLKSLADWRTYLDGLGVADKDTHSAAGDPLFVSPSTADFHLQAASPARDAGVDVGLTSDYAGRTVPTGSGVDIGAYEWWRKRAAGLLQPPIGALIGPLIGDALN